MMEIVRTFALLMIGFIVGLFSPVRVGVGIQRIRVNRGGLTHKRKDLLLRMAENFRENGNDEFADLAEAVASGKDAAIVIKGMSPEMKRKWREFHKIGKED